MIRKHFLAFLLIALGHSFLFANENQKEEPAQKLSLFNEQSGIGFDDMGFSSRHHRVLVPAGATGKLFLIDPQTKNMEIISGFLHEGKYTGGHDDGVTSVDEMDGMLFAIDRTAQTLDVVDVSAKKIILKKPLGDEPDYVRTISSSHEVWVTEPHRQRIEIFTYSSESHTLELNGTLDIPGGPESLVIDEVRNRAYTNLWKEETLALDLKLHQIVSRWPNHCQGSRGLALDSAKGRLFVGCSEGKAVTLDLINDGKILGETATGLGVDIISFNSTLNHLYVPAAKSATLTTLSVSSAGELSVLKTEPAASRSHCVIHDDQNQIWVCDPDHGRLLIFRDLK